MPEAGTILIRTAVRARDDVREPDADEVVCVYGLTRQGRDFDAPAARLADAGCPELMGRGRMLMSRPQTDAVLSFLASCG